MKNWRTTTWGVLAIVAALSGAGVLLLDDNPATNPDWNQVFGAVVIALGVIFNGVAAVLSRDAKTK